MPLRHLKRHLSCGFQEGVIGCASFNLFQPCGGVRMPETSGQLKELANTRHPEDAAAAAGSPRLSFRFIDFRVREGQVSILR